MIGGDGMAHPCILFIENEWETKKRIILLLTLNDFEVVPVDSLFNAQRMIRTISPQLVICSEHLPDGDVTDFLNILRSSKDFSDRPLVVLASSNETEARKFTKLGATEIISSAMSDEQIIKVLNRQIQIHLPGLHQSSSGITGQLHKLSITDLIHELAQRHGSGKITIDAAEEMAIFLKDGLIIHARHGITVGKKALYRCLQIADAAYQFQRNINDVEPSIEASELDHLIREAAMSNQKLMVNFHRYPSKFSRINILDYAFFEKPNLSPKIKAAMEIIKRHPIVHKFIDFLNLPDIACYELLDWLAGKEVIAFSEKQKNTTILVDNSCDLSPLDFTKHQVSVLPLSLKNDKTITPNRSVHSKNFLTFSRKDWDLSTIETFSKEGFLQCFSTLNKDYEILTIVPTQVLLPTGQTLEPMIRELREKGIDGIKLHDYETCIYQSNTFSLGYGLLTIKAAALAAQNLPGELLMEKLNFLEERLQMIWVENQSSGGLLGKNQQSYLFRWNGKEIIKERKLTKDETLLAVFKEEINRRLDVKSNLSIAVGGSHPSQTRELETDLSMEFAYSTVFGFEVTPVNMKLMGSQVQIMAFVQD